MLHCHNRQLQYINTSMTFNFAFTRKDAQRQQDIRKLFTVGITNTRK